MTSMPAPITAPLPPVPRRNRRGLIVTAIVAGVVAGGLGFAGSALWAATHDEVSHAPRVGTKVDMSAAPAPDSGARVPASGWSSTEEGVVLSLIESKSMFDGYDSGCVLGVIEDHFPSLDDFTVAAETDSPEITSVAYDVILECGAAGTRAA
jgi:hypothetical protein